MKLTIKPENEEIVRELAQKMSDSSLTSAVNFVLKKAGHTVLEELEGIGISRGSNTNTNQRNNSRAIKTKD